MRMIDVRNEQAASYMAEVTGRLTRSVGVCAVSAAIAAGCRFFAGYPITPSTEIAERVARRFPLLGGVFIQMEDELASMAAIAGASLGGVKSMSCTSGPGFSLMMENYGYAIMTETPCVIANVQRTGPSTGQPTLGAQGDMMQVRWGSHGDMEAIAYAPSTVQECLDMTIDSFNLSEKYRHPVCVMTDGEVGRTFARFRFSSTGGLSYDGHAPDGEVEDYSVWLDYQIPAPFIVGSWYSWKAHKMPPALASPL